MRALPRLDPQSQVSLASCRRIDLSKVAFANKDAVSAAVAVQRATLGNTGELLFRSRHLEPDGMLR